MGLSFARICFEAMRSVAHNRLSGIFGKLDGFRQFLVVAADLVKLVQALVDVGGYRLHALRLFALRVKLITMDGFMDASQERCDRVFSTRI